MSRMKNLESLVWARDKLLNPDLLRSISQLPQISSLVLSGHAHHYYNPCLIGGMNFLKLLDVVAALAMRASRSLKELSIGTGLIFDRRYHIEDNDPTLKESTSIGIVEMHKDI
nr:hypothetical protein L203_01950 [Cryptococcus depauperatus CBS 7841]